MIQNMNRLMTENILQAEQTTSHPFTEIGLSNFESFINNKDAIFVDKTVFIKSIIDSKAVTLITRPRRWGKTLNMSMLEYFFSIPVKKDGTVDEEKYQQKYDILSKMGIGSYKNIMDDACCKYPTIFVSFKDIKATSFEEILLQTRHLIQELFVSHKYLLSSERLDEFDKATFTKFLMKEFDIAEAQSSLKILSRMLHNHFRQQVIVLIDEYDSPMNDWYAQKLSSGDKIDSEHNNHLQEVLGLFRGMFSAALKDNKYLYKGVITGILRIAKSSLFSGLNNFTEDSILDNNYSKYFGFTAEEVNWLLHESNMDRDQSTVDQMQSWYNGYNIGGITIYNPWSIMNWLDSKGKFKAYWVRTASNALIENALMLDTFQSEVQSLIEGEVVEMIANPHMVFSEINTSTNALYNLLLFSGYLTVIKVSQNVSGITYKCNVRIPNQEVRGIFIESVQQWIISKLNIPSKEYDHFVRFLLSGDIKSFIEKLRVYVESSGSYFDSGEQKAEVLYNGMMWGIFASSMSEDYFVEKERETGEGRADLLIIPKSTADYNIAFVLEYKVASKSEDLVSMAGNALEQIKNKNYISKIKGYENVSKVISIGLAFCGKDVEVVHSETDLKLQKK